MMNDQKKILENQPNKPGHPDRNGPDSELAVDPHTGEKHDDAKSHVRIRNHHGAAIGLPPVSERNAKTETFDIKHEEKHLVPGDSNVDAAHWAEVSKKSPVKDFVKSGLLELVHGGDTSQPEGQGNVHVHDMPDHAAVKHVATMEDHAELQKAFKGEARPHVKSAMARQLEKLGVKK